MKAQSSSRAKANRNVMSWRIVRRRTCPTARWVGISCQFKFLHGLPMSVMQEL
jgi:hypothetical protein